MTTKRLIFYETQSLDSIEYSIGVLFEKILSKKKQIAVLCTSDEKLKYLDDKLWTFSPDYFIPHAIYTHQDDAVHHPVILSTDITNIKSRDVLCIYTEYDDCITYISSHSEDLFNNFDDVIFLGNTAKIKDRPTLNNVEQLHFKYENKNWIKV